MGVFVVGMHRSGTSAVVRVLESLGYTAGDESDFHAPTEHDPLGHREHILVWRANEAALAAAGGAWDDPVDLDWSRLGSEAGNAVHSAVDLALTALDKHAPWVAKDPRLCLTLPLWRRATAPVCVMLHRNPMDVARSLAARDAMPIFGGLALWEWCQRSALAGSAGLTRVYASFSDLTTDPVSFRARLAHQLRDAAPVRAGPGVASRPTGFDAALWRQRSPVGEVAEWLNPGQRQLLDALELATTATPGAEEAIAAATAAPVSAQATEVLTTLAHHRRRQAEMEQRDHEISQWNEHLQRRLEAPT